MQLIMYALLIYYMVSLGAWAHVKAYFTNAFQGTAYLYQGSYENFYGDTLLVLCHCMQYSEFGNYCLPNPQ